MQQATVNVPPDKPTRYKLICEPKQLEHLRFIDIRASLGDFGNLKHLSHTDDGILLTFIGTVSNDLLNASMIGTTPVTIKEFCCSKGTVYCPDLGDCSDEEINRELNGQAKLIKRLPTRFKNSKQSGRLLLEFPTLEVPETITLLCHLRLEIKQHIPIPLRCRKCLTLGHHERLCVEEQRCANCAELGHDLAACTKASHCYACDGMHPITAPNCPIFRREMEINRTRITKNISLSQARMEVKRNRTNRTPQLNRTTKRPSAQNQIEVPAKNVADNNGYEMSGSYASIAAGSAQSKRICKTSTTSEVSTQDGDTKLPTIDLLLRAMCNIEKLISTQNALITTVLEQNLKILQAISTKTESKKEEQSPTLSKRPRTVSPVTPPSDTRVAPSTTSGQRSQPRSQPIPKRMVNLGLDTLGSPLAANIGTYDIKEI